MNNNLVTSRVEYGYSGTGDRKIISEVPVAASQTLDRRGGRFAAWDGSRHLTIASALSAALAGFIDDLDFVSSTSAGKDKVQLDISTESECWLPANAAVTEAMRGKLCDIVMNGTIQQADVTASVTNVLHINEVDVINQRVRVNINILDSTGV